MAKTDSRKQNSDYIEGLLDSEKGEYDEYQGDSAWERRAFIEKYKMLALISGCILFYIYKTVRK